MEISSECGREREGRDVHAAQEEKRISLFSADPAIEFLSSELRKQLFCLYTLTAVLDCTSGVEMRGKYLLSFPTRQELILRPLRVFFSLAISLLRVNPLTETISRQIAK